MHWSSQLSVISDSWQVPRLRVARRPRHRTGAGVGNSSPMAVLFLRSVATLLCAEGAFYLWGSYNRRSLSNPRQHGFADALQPPSGMTFSAERRRKEFRRILTTEFGVCEEGGMATTPARGRIWLSGWFFNKPFSQIDVSGLRFFLAWVWFNCQDPSEMSAAEATEVEADVATLLKAASAESPTEAQRVLPSEPARSRSRGLTCMRPNVDATRPFHAHHPLLIYFLTQFLIGTLLRSYVMTSLGFERRTLRVPCTDDPSRLFAHAYWHRPRPAETTSDPATSDSDVTPLVLFHGIGIGWGFSYPPLLADMVAQADAAGGRPILAVEAPHIALTVPVNYGPHARDMVCAVCAMLARHGVDVDGRGGRVRADILGHSYGTLTAAQVLKQCPAVVRSMTLVDPVCVGAHRAKLCQNFLYDPDYTGEGAPGVIKKWLLHSDPRLVGTLMRNFFWFENCLWLEDDELDAAAAGTEGSISLFIGENDKYIDGAVIYEDAITAMASRAAENYGTPNGAEDAMQQPRRSLRAVLWTEQGHGEWLSKPEQRRAVIESLVVKTKRS